MDPPKINLFERLNLECQSVMISADIYQTNILTNFGSATPQGPPQTDPQKSIFERLKLGCQCFMISGDI